VCESEGTKGGYSPRRLLQKRVRKRLNSVGSAQLEGSHLRCLIHAAPVIFEETSSRALLIGGYVSTFQREVGCVRMWWWHRRGESHQG
jgi:hypothetical protein